MLRLPLNIAVCLHTRVCLSLFVNIIFFLSELFCLYVSLCNPDSFGFVFNYLSVVPLHEAAALRFTGIVVMCFCYTMQYCLMSACANVGK